MKTNLPGRILVSICKYISVPLCIIAAFFMCAASATARTAAFNYAGSGRNATSGAVSYKSGRAQVNTTGTRSDNGLGTTSVMLTTPATALNFDGTNDYVSISNPYTAFNKEITVEFWMNPATANLPFGSVMGQGTSNVDDWSANNVWLMHPNINGTMTFYVNDAGNARYAQCNLIAGSWHHYAGVASASSTKIYVDGVLVATGPGISNTILNNSGSVIHIGKDVRYNIGKSYDIPRYANMSIDEVRIWSRALCQDEIIQTMNCEASAQTALQELYHFNQGIVNADNTGIATLTDASGNNRNGMLNNFALNGSTSNWVTSGSTNTGTCAVYTAPTAPITGTTSICAGAGATLSNAISGGVWTSSNTGVATINASSGAVTSVAAGTTTITYTTECGGISTAMLTVNPIPVATIAAVGSTISCSQVMLNANTGGGYTYQWKRNGIDISGATNASYDASISGNYTVVITSNGCVSLASNTITVTINSTPVFTTCPSNKITPADAGKCTAVVSYTVGATGLPLPTLTYTFSGATNKTGNGTGSGQALNYGVTTVTISAANSCGTTNCSFTVTVTAVDTDGDGIPDACDEDADNDGIPNVLECNKSNFFWSNAPNISGNTATGTINGIGYTYTSSSTVRATADMYGNHNFPASYGVPNANPTIQNIEVTNNTLTFASPMTNPVLVFASIGQAGLSVPITFSAPVQIVWSLNVVQNSATQITGTEGYVIVRMMGTFSSISFNYLVAENYCNFAFGADFQSCADTDGDGIPDYLDTDSDGDGCPDAIEGSMGFSLSQTINGRLVGPVDSRGIPILAGNGQGIGTSQNYAANCFCQPGLDKTPPTVITKNITINLNAGGTAAITASQVNNGSTDNCGIASINVSKTSFDCSNTGANTVTLTVTDNQGNVGTATATVTVVDNIFPVISCPGNISINATSGAGAVVTYATPVGTDNCSVTTTRSAGFASGATFPIGVTTVTHMATDASGNTTNCSFTVTVTGLAPVINCPANVTVNAIAGQCGANVAFAATETTAIPASAITYTENGNPVTSGSFFPVGTHTIFATAVNAVGVSTCNFTISVVDDQFPVLTGVPSDITVECNAVPSPASVTASDNCSTSIPTFTETRTDGNCPGRYTLTRKWSTTDASGNTTVAAQVITVQDTQAPVLSAAPADVTVDCSAVPAAPVLMATDNCDGAPVVTYTQTSTQDANVNNTGHYNYILTRTWTATDACMNFSTKTQVITVHDVTAPVIAVPANISVNNDKGLCGAVVNFAATATDNCSPVTITYSSNPGILFNVGVTTVTITAKDVSGNTTINSFTVTVNDTEKPTITSAPNQTQTNDAGDCGAKVTVAVPTTGDNCAVQSITNSYTGTANASGHYPFGTTTITWTVTDIHGNTNTSTQQVTVTDDEKPNVITKPVTVTLINGVASITAAMVNNGSTDNCYIQSIEVAPSVFHCANIGSNTVTLTVTDIHGNVAAKTATVTVVGEIPGCTITSVPTINTFTGGNPNNLYLGYGAQSTTLQVTPTGVSGNGGPNYTYTYSWSGASVSMLSSTTSGAPVFTPTKSGYYTFTVVTTNNYGCSTTCTISICVTDIRVPGTNGAKVYVCHLPPGNTGNPQTLSISVNAVPAHLGNHAGDRLGSCSQAPCSNVALASAGVTSIAVSKEGKEEATTGTEKDLKVTVMPNPSATIFTLKLESRYATPVNMRVMDANGRVIDTRSGIGSNSTIQIGHNYSSGTYYAELMQDNRRKVVQLIKGK